MWTSTLIGLFIAFVCCIHFSDAKVNYRVKCSEKWMTVDVDMDDGISQVYLDKLKGYPACYPKVSDGVARFRLPLFEFHKCAVTRVVNQINGIVVYYHRIVAESTDKQEVVLVRCDIGGPGNSTLNRTRRQALPAGFREPETVTISDYIVARAPIPYLNLAVKQNGRIVDTTLNVQPGALLQMEVSLDGESSDTYGLLTSFLNVTDNTPNKQEKIIENGCAVDPYIFGNFYTVDGDILTAKFRAFKFPNTNFVLFIGIVNVCLQKCRGVPCGNGQIGYGRRKREIFQQKDPNKAYEVELTTLLRVERSEDINKNYPALHKSFLAGEFDQKIESETPALPEYIENDGNYKVNGGNTVVAGFNAIFMVFLAFMAYCL